MKKILICSNSDVKDAMRLQVIDVSFLSKKFFKDFLTASKTILVLSLFAFGICISQAKEQNTPLDLDAVSVKGLDKNVAKIFKQTRKLIKQARKKEDKKTELLAIQQWCLLLHSYNFLEQAMECYYELGMEDKKEPKWTYLYAKTSLSQGDFDKAETALKETLRRDFLYLPAHYYLLDMAIKDHKLLDAFEILSNIPAQFRLNSSLLNLAGDLYFEVENYYVAIGFFQQALNSVPKAKSLNYKIAKAYQALNSMQKAEKFMQEADEVKIQLNDPYFQEVKNKTIGEIPYLIKAKSALVNGEAETAIKAYNKALEFNPNSEAALVNIAVAHFQNKNTKQAIENFQKVLAINPKKKIALYNLGLIAEMNGDYSAAQSLFEKYFALDSEDVSLNFRLANLYYNKGEFEKALQMTQLKSAKTHVGMQLLKSKVFVQLGQYQKAILWLQEINKYVPNNAKVLLSLTKLLSQVPDNSLRNPSQAIVYAKQALAVEKSEAIYWQLIVAMDENKSCDELEATALEFSRYLQIELNQVYEKLFQYRGADLKCRAIVQYIK